jgi:predicted enzyme related to lactoylglutathione lyase
MPRPIHFEIHGDPEAAVDFYRAVFGWEIQKWGEAPYWLAGTGEGPGIDGAIAPVQEHDQQVVLTVQVEDLTKAVARVREAGGTIMTERSPIPGVGDLAQAVDPNGVVFGMLEPAAD